MKRTVLVPGHTFDRDYGVRAVEGRPTPGHLYAVFLCDLGAPQAWFEYSDTWLRVKIAGGTEDVPFDGERAIVLVPKSAGFLELTGDSSRASGWVRAEPLVEVAVRAEVEGA